MPRNARLRVVLPDRPGPGIDVRSDEELVAAIRRGDKRIGAEVCERLLSVVDATLFRVLGRREPDHDDLVQAAIEQVVTTLHNGKFSGRCSLTTWASAIASNVALHAIRRRRVERRLFSESDDAEQVSRTFASGDPERQAHARHELERVRAHLARMSPKLAETLVMHDVLGCELAETARLVNASISATQSRLVRGRKELGQRLSLELEGEEGEGR